ncbi:translocase of inner mitochondrial membrane domain containing 1, partial [Homo sapiens]
MEVPPPAPRSFLCRALCLFPRVFAAEAVTADSEVLEERQKRLPYVPEPYYPESGWDRLRELFGKDTVNTSLNVYRNKDALSHFVIAGAVTGSLFRINVGLRGLVAGGIIGALLGTPVGGLLMAFQKYSGETVQERKQKDRKALHELKLEE